jgi:2-polyprenyl-3-methyl-5-hydroxy-6-metoxy-1,4-benzoquinol methylase
MNKAASISVEVNRSQKISERDTFTEIRYLQMISYARNKGSVLDLGCNTGRGGLVIKSIYPDCVIDGVEIVSERIDKIPPGIYRNIYSNSVENVDYGPIKYDAILAGEFAEHITLCIFKKMLKLFHQLLNPEGMVIFTTPNPDYFMIKLGKRGVIKDSSHVNIMTIKFFKELLGDMGYQNINVKGTGRVSRIIGTGFPYLSIYGSYMITADIQPDSGINGI